MAKKDVDIFSDLSEELEEKKEAKKKTMLDEFEVKEVKKAKKKPFSFYLDVKYNELLEEHIENMKREAKRKGIKIDISKSKLLEKILDDYFKL